MKQKSKAHGISVFVKTGLFPTIFKIENTKSKCILWIALGFSPHKISLVVGGVYIPGCNSKFSHIYDYDIISEDIIFINSKFKCPFVLLGDFNSRTGKLDDFLSQNKAKESLNNMGLETQRFNLDEKIDTHGRNLINLCNDFNLCILNGRFGNDKKVGQFTCIKTIGQSLVDYIVVSTSLFPSVLNFHVDKYDNCMSDVHLPLSTTIKVANEFKKPNEIVTQKYETLEYRATWNAEKKSEYQDTFSKEKILSLTKKLEHISCTTEITQENIDYLTTELTNILVEPAKQVGMCKKNSKNKKIQRKSPNKPWFNESCEKSRKNYFQEKNAIWASKTSSEKNLCISKMKEKGKAYKKFISKVQKTHNKKFHENLRKYKRFKPKDYWELLKNEERQGKKGLKVPLGAFQKHFEELNQSANQSFENPVVETNDSFNQDINADFTLHELNKNIKLLKNNKAAGIDLVKNEYIKNAPQIVIELAVTLFNLVLKTGVVPLEWCLGLIIPIYKNKGSPTDPNNYRGITLLSCLGKFFTFCINIRLGKFLESYGIIGEEQAAYREGYGTLDHVFVFNEIINLYLEKKKKIIRLFH